MMTMKTMAIVMITTRSQDFNVPLHHPGSPEDEYRRGYVEEEDDDEDDDDNEDEDDTTLLASVNTLIARGMFCGSKYTHHSSHFFIFYLQQTTSNKDPGKKSWMGH